MQLALDGRIRFVDAAPPRQARRIIAGALVFGAAMWFASVFALWLAEPHLVFMTHLSRRHTAPLDPGIFHSQTFVSSDRLRLNGVVLTHGLARDGYWILFCPPAGASTRVKRIQDHLKQLWTLGYNVMAFDYRGFGDSPGIPSEDGLYADAAAAYAHLVGQQRVPPSRIILAGRSLGSAVAVDLATRVDAAGLVLFAPIDSVPQAGARVYPFAPVRWLASHQFDAAAKASAISIPVVTVFAARDQYMPPTDARALFDRFHGPKLMIETAGGHHHSGFVHIAELYRALARFWPTASSKKD
ncbi:MAG: alpha/beta hydrolase [Vicinamibacterales bacterium]